MTDATKIERLKNMKVGEEILVNNQVQILLHFSEEKKIIYVKDINSIDGSSIKVNLSDVSFLPKEDKSFIFQKGMVLTASLGLSSISAFMTIVGYMNFFYLNQIIIGLLFGAIELVKFVSATIIFNNINISNKHKVGLFFFLSILIVISTIGHYSYLTQSFFANQKTANIKTENISSKIELVKSNIIDLETENKRLDMEISTIPESKKTLKAQTIAKNSKKIKENNQKIADERKEIMFLTDSLEKETSLSMEKQTANNTLSSLGENKDKYAGFLIFLLALIIDPLAFYFAYLFGTLKKKD